MPPTAKTLPVKAAPTKPETPVDEPTTVKSNAADAGAPELNFAELMDRIRVLEEQAKKAQNAQAVTTDDPYKAAVINLRVWAESKRNARPDVDFNPLLKILSKKDNGEYVDEIDDTDELRELVAELLEENSGKELESVKPLLKDLRNAER